MKPPAKTYSTSVAHHGELVLRRPRGKREAPAINESVNAVYERLGAECQRLVKRGLNVLRLADIQRQNFDAVSTRF